MHCNLIMAQYESLLIPFLLLYLSSAWQDKTCLLVNPGSRTVSFLCAGKQFEHAQIVFQLTSILSPADFHAVFSILRLGAFFFYTFTCRCSLYVLYSELLKAQLIALLSDQQKSIRAKKKMLQHDGQKKCDWLNTGGSIFSVLAGIFKCSVSDYL